MKRFPIVATIVVLVAIATMIGLGVWQIHRAQWKEALLAQYSAAVGAPLLQGLPTGSSIDPVAFRRADVVCTLTTGATQLGGHNAQYVSGFRNIAGCRTEDGRLLAVDLGWSGISDKPRLPAIGTRFDFRGRVIPDDVLAKRVIGDGPGMLPILLVAETPAPGLKPSIPPDISDIPNNHRSYAVQWFLFAAVATVIYALALRRYR